MDENVMCEKVRNDNDLIEKLRYMAKVYSFCNNENTQEYQLAVAAADAIEELSGKLSLYEANEKEFLRYMRDCRNELCLKCGDYKMRHKGACDGCRWRESV